MLKYILIGLVLAKEKKNFWKVDNDNDESYSFHRHKKNDYKITCSYISIGYRSTKNQSSSSRV